MVSIVSTMAVVVLVSAGVLSVVPARVSAQPVGEKPAPGEKQSTGEKPATGEKRASGIYLEPAAGSPKADMTRLEGNMPDVQSGGVGAAAAFGFGKPKISTKVAGDKATLRVAPQSTFLFVFGERNNMRAMMEDPMAAMSALPAHTSSPKDYALIRLALVEGDRVYDSKKGQQVKCAVEKLDAKTFRIKTEQPLEPGEYAFATMMSGVAGMLWDFGVDGPATQ
jgi:hypothetical protein